MGFFRAVARRPIIIAGLLIFLAGVVASGAGASPRVDPAGSPSGVSARRTVFKDQGEIDRIARTDVSEPLRLFVQLRSSPLSDLPGLRQERLLEAEHRAFRTRMRRAGIPFRELSSHRRLFNGLSVEVPAGQVGRIAGLRGVAGLFLVRSSDMPRPHLSSSVPMVGAPRAWAGDPERAIPGVDGTGVTVAVIDTGIDYTHPDLGGCLGPGCRVVAGYDLVGDQFDGENEPVPDEDPMDLNGHGTHVAGIVGARASGPDGVTGVAPGVQFVALKVFGPTGHTWDDIILEALEMADAMGVDVINMSIGSAFQWPQYPTAQAVQRLTKKGVIVATSAGNSGESGEFATGAPAVGPGSLAVASFENDSVRKRSFLNPEGAPIPYDLMEESPEPPAREESPELVYAGLGAADEEFQNPDGSSKVAGKVALIRRGEISFRDKSLNAQRHGAVQAIIFNHRDGALLGTLQTPGDYIPTVGITRADGEHLLELMEQGPVKVTWTDGLRLFPNPSAGQVSNFSSWGPAPDLSLKPELMAPGGNIYSTYLVSAGGYTTMSGTSMASPHVAGAAALLLQAERSGITPAKATAIRTLLINTAQPRTEGLESERLLPVHRQGAGLIDVWQAMRAEQRVLPEQIGLGEVQGGDGQRHTVVVENLTDRVQTYQIELLGAAGGPAVELAVDPGPVRVGPRRTVRIPIQLQVPPSLPDGEIFSGWIALRSADGTVVAHIPYLGFKGDYQAAPVLDPLSFGLPWLARLDGQWLRRSSAMEIIPGCGCKAEFAWILFSLGRQPRELRLEIWDSVTGRKMGNGFSAQYLSRSDGGIEAFLWDGYSDKGRLVPPGTYHLRLLALRPLGDRGNPDHWDLWTSGQVKVVQP